MLFRKFIIMLKSRFQAYCLEIDKTFNDVPTFLAIDNMNDIIFLRIIMVCHLVLTLKK